MIEDTKLISRSHVGCLKETADGEGGGGKGRNAIEALGGGEEQNKRWKV